jgi:hypothetical protein
MSGVFKDVYLAWRDRKYTVAANKVMGAIAVIERHVTLKELYEHGKRGSVPLAALASAYADVLEYAGAEGVDARELYQDMFSGSSPQSAIIEAIQGLIAMMIPPQTLADASPKNLNRRQRRKAAAAARSSQKPSN